jgi:hypothetical protein
MLPAFSLDELAGRDDDDLALGERRPVARPSPAHVRAAPFLAIVRQLLLMVDGDAGRRRLSEVMGKPRLERWRHGAFPDP